MDALRTQSHDASISARLRRIADLAPTVPGLSDATRAMISRCVGDALRSAGDRQRAGREPAAPAVESSHEARTERRALPVGSHRERLDRLERSMIAIRRTFDEILQLTNAACKQCIKRRR